MEDKIYSHLLNSTLRMYDRRKPTVDFAITYHPWANPPKYQRKTIEHDSFDWFHNRIVMTHNQPKFSGGGDVMYNVVIGYQQRARTTNSEIGPVADQK